LKGYEYHALPVPDPIYVEGAMVSASYVNYLVLNGAVIVPIFGQAKDQEALSIIQSCFPTREVIGFNCLEIIREGGGLHCLSLNQPLTN
jgi:agmatine deiminase